MKRALLFFTAFLLTASWTAAQELTDLDTSNLRSTIPAVGDPNPVKTAGGSHGEVAPLVTPDPLPNAPDGFNYYDINKEEYTSMLEYGSTREIKPIAIACIGYLDGYAADFSNSARWHGAAAIKPRNWDARRYNYPAGASAYLKSGLRLITWWREYNYWSDRLYSKEFKPNGTAEERYKFLQLAGMVLWYEMATAAEAKSIINTKNP